jgi:ligand-binding sensor domain-containing protein/two-component sensor histidine kinase
MRRAAGVIGCLIAIVAALPGEGLPVRIFTTSDGLANNTIDRIVEDSRGFLWFCTREGLSRFDGYQFTTYGADQGLPGLIRDLIEMPAGDYWVATSRGLARFEPASPRPRFEFYLTEDPAARSINVLGRDPAGGIWAGTAQGLYHLDPAPAANRRETGRWKARLVEIGLPHEAGRGAMVIALLTDRGGDLWVGSGSGLYRLCRDGRCERIRETLPNLMVSALLQDRGGRLWVGTKRGLCRISMSAPLSRRSIGSVYFAGVPVNSMLESSEGRLWVATDRGLGKWLIPAIDGREGFENYTAANGLGGGQVQALAEDRAGNLWLGSAGANRIAKGGFSAYGTQDGLDSVHVVSVGEDRNGGLFAVTESPRGKLVNRYDGHRFHPVRPNIPREITDWGWGSNQITLQDRAGQWWVPTSQGVFRFPAFSTHPAGSPPLSVYLDRASAYRVFQDSRGDVWMSAQVYGGQSQQVIANRLARWERSTGVLRDYPGMDPYLGTAYGEDRAGNVWIGLSNGTLARYRDGRFDFIGQAGGWVDALHTDRQGRLWAATSQGALRLDEPDAAKPAMVVYTTAQGLSSNAVECITEDRWGRIYLGTGHGVDCISPGTPPRIRHYTTADGLARGDFRAAFRDREGKLWFATTEGLSRLDPEPEGPPARPPVLITALRVRGVPHPLSSLGESELSAIELRPDQNQVQFEFVGLSFAAGEALNYQYRLTGVDQDWSPADGQRTVNYANLGPGDYRWQVRAVAADGSLSQRPATVIFTVLPPLWQRGWLRLLLLISACGVLYTLYRYRLARYLEVERLRTRIATDLHDDIGSTLAQIAILSEVANRNPSQKGREDPLSDIAGLSRELVDSMSDIVWAIDPEEDRLLDLAHRMRRFASDLFTPSGVRVEFHAPEEQQDPHMGPDIRRQIFLIFKETLHNAARHSACTVLKTELRLANGWLELAVSDNGKGFDAASIRPGHGLLSLQRRASQLGGSITVISEPPSGTSVRLRVPLAQPAGMPWRTMLLKQVGEDGPLRRMLRKGRSG